MEIIVGVKGGDAIFVNKSTGQVQVSRILYPENDDKNPNESQSLNIDDVKRYVLPKTQFHNHLLVDGNELKFTYTKRDVPEALLGREPLMI